MSLLGKLKNALQASAAENALAKERMAALFMQSLQADALDGYQLAYGKHMKAGPSLSGGSRHTFYNYVVGYKPDPVNIDVVLVPVDADLRSYGAPILINTKTFKKAGKTFLSGLYKFKTIYGNSFVFQVPPVNGKAASMMGSEEVAINQEAEARLFKAFFEQVRQLSGK
ncbi:hypothetical protein [Chitinophaga defluvii]|uniref:Uncharacterized protein n=1 Tax=Chitinophaga defluvii TaxID=3163343 RepID=A0ABV2SZT4_9BACT